MSSNNNSLEKFLNWSNKILRGRTLSCLFMISINVKFSIRLKSFFSFNTIITLSLVIVRVNLKPSIILLVNKRMLLLLKLLSIINFIIPPLFYFMFFLFKKTSKYDIISGRRRGGSCGIKRC